MSHSQRKTLLVSVTVSIGLLAVVLLYLVTSVQAQAGTPQSITQSNALCVVNLNIVGGGYVDMDPNAGNDPELSVEIDEDLNYAVMENSEIYVRFERYVDLYDETEQFSIRQFRLKKHGNADQSGPGYLDAAYHRGALTNAYIKYDGPDYKTVRFEWVSKPNNPDLPANKPFISEISIYPNSKFLKIDYIDNSYSVVMVDLGRPGGTTTGQNVAYGAAAWNRDYVAHPESYFSILTDEEYNDPPDGGSLNYKNNFIMGVYNPVNNQGLGRTFPIRKADDSGNITRAIKFLANADQRHGFEVTTPEPWKGVPFTSFLYAVTGGPSEIVNLGKALIDGDYGDYGVECGTPVELTAVADAPEYTFDRWEGDLTGSDNPSVITPTVDQSVTAYFLDIKPPVVSGQDPAPGAVDVPANTNVVAHVVDGGDGVKQGSIVMRVNGVNVTNSAVISGTPGDYTVTYDPPNNFAYDSTVDVSVTACDQATPSNCMASPTAYSFTTGTNDPPVISNVKAVPNPGGATITWTTNEPATSVLEWGDTPGLGNSIDPDPNPLVTSHFMQITGLLPQKTYYYKVTSADEIEEATSSQVLSFTTQSAGPVVSDDFNSCSLNAMWQFVNPLGDASYNMTDTQMELIVPGGINHDVWPENGKPTNRAPRIMQQATDPNNLNVKFEKGVGQRIQMQGVIIEQDADNFLRINFQYDDDGRTRMYVIGFASGVDPNILHSVQISGANANNPIYMSVTRNGGTWTAWYSTDGSNYQSVSFNFPLAVMQVGAFAGNAGSNPPPFTAVIDYFFNITTPISPEDGKPLRLPVNVQGNGRVEKDAECGNPMTLTAVTDPNWEFVEWQGSTIDGATNPTVNVSYDFGDEVTAVFQAVQYELDVQIVSDGSGSGGTVSLDPPGGSYTNGTVVTLTAQPSPGWRFGGWDGIPGNPTGSTAQLTITDDTQVTATFIQNQYSLSVATRGQGSVQVAPLRTTYLFGDVVQLIATPAAGWHFERWSGAISGTDLSTQLEIKGDASVTAVFKPDTSLVYLPSVLNGR